MLFRTSLKIKLLLFFSILLGLLCSPISFLKEIHAEDLPTVVKIVVTVCGNNIKESGEQCDGTDLNNKTCVSLGYSGGTLVCSPACVFNTSGCTSGGGGGGSGGVSTPSPTETKVIIQGLAYPNSAITILKDGVIIDTITADKNANFKDEIGDINAGISTFGLWAEDSAGNRSLTFSFTINVSAGMITTISNIFLPPTIDLTATQLHQGEILGILGQTAPNVNVVIHINTGEPIIKTIKSDFVGAYFYNFDTSPLEVGEHFTKTKSANPSNSSITDFSKTVSFQLLAPGTPITAPQPEGRCGNVNLNYDFVAKKTESKKETVQPQIKQDKVDFTDVSILLYNWGTPKNSRADLNGDGVVNYTDLSILLYCWTG